MVNWIRKLIPSEQAGFREHRCTEDQATYLAQEIKNGFQHKMQSRTIWIELQKPFNKVWTDGLLLKLKKYNISGNLFWWIKSYLHNRRARVVVDNTKSKKIILRHGVPQGGAMSPTLFLVFINDFINKFHPQCIVMYVFHYMQQLPKKTPRSNQYTVKLGTRLVCKDK